MSAKTGQDHDLSEKIYHSGDNLDGTAEGDDEEISVELRDIPDHIHHIIFTAGIQTGHVFAEIDACEMRIADGYTGHSFLSTPLICEEGKDKNAYVFIRIFRENDDEWNIHYIGQYVNAQSLDNKEEYLGRFLSE